MRSKGTNQANRLSTSGIQHRFPTPNFSSMCSALSIYTIRSAAPGIPNVFLGSELLSVLQPYDAHESRHSNLCSFLIFHCRLLLPLLLPPLQSTSMFPCDMDFVKYHKPPILKLTSHYLPRLWQQYS